MGRWALRARARARVRASDTCWCPYIPLLRPLSPACRGRAYIRSDGAVLFAFCAPQESCDLLVLDRSYDAVAPFIHEWSYEALAYDLVPIEGNVYK